ncbi:hypothetical protein D3C80_2092200 [compost metagenome]
MRYPQSWMSASMLERVIPGSSVWDNSRVTTDPEAVRMNALFELPSVTSPSRTSQASSAPCCLAASFAMQA